jgi:hypothetical protein
MITVSNLYTYAEKTKNENVVVRFVSGSSFVYALVLPIKRVLKAYRKYAPHNLSLKRIISYVDPTVYYRDIEPNFDVERFWVRIFQGHISADLSEMSADEIECFLTLDGYDKYDSLKKYIKERGIYTWKQNIIEQQ